MTREAKLLGYCSLEEKWELVVRDVTWETMFPDGEETTINPHCPVPLLEASRLTRIRAMRLIPRLLDEIKRQAEAALGDIERTEKTVQEL